MTSSRCGHNNMPLPPPLLLMDNRIVTAARGFCYLHIKEFPFGVFARKTYRLSEKDSLYIEGKRRGTVQL